MERTVWGGKAKEKVVRKVQNVQEVPKALFRSGISSFNLHQPIELLEPLEPMGLFSFSKRHPESNIVGENCLIFRPECDYFLQGVSRFCLSG